MKVISESDSGLEISYKVKKIAIRDSEYRWNKKLYIFSAPMSYKEYLLIHVAMGLGKKFENYIIDM